VLTVRGKGGKTRMAYPGVAATAAVEAWLEIRHAHGTADAGGPLFVPITRHAQVVVRPLTDKALYLVLQKRAGEAGLATLSPHDFRRTFVGDLLDSGADLATAQQLAGHASPTTTARYDRRGERTKREAAGRLAVPFVG
jgi:site-specific recombinase XerD